MKKIFYILTIIFSLWLLGFYCFCTYIFNYDIDTQTKTDAIIVLTGGRNRISEAGKLLQNNMAKKMFITGVNKNITLKAIEKINSLNINSNSNIFIGKKALDTKGNAIEATEWILKNNINSIRLVTSNYHMPRSLQEFKALNPKLTIISHPVYSEKVSNKWWKKWHTSKLIAAEYNKFLYVYIRNIIQAKESIS